MLHDLRLPRFSRLPLRQLVQIICTSPLLVQMYYCTEEFRICWTIHLELFSCGSILALTPVKLGSTERFPCGGSNAGFRLACRLPLCRYAAWSSLAVSELQLSAVTPLWLYHRAASLPSWIEFNCLRSAAVGKAARLSILLAWRCLPLGHPSAASGACAVEQISSSKWQCSKRQVSLKPTLGYREARYWQSGGQSLIT